MSADPTSAAPPPLVATSPRPCPICATMNAAGLRYCTSCGSTLDAAPLSAGARDTTAAPPLEEPRAVARSGPPRAASPSAAPPPLPAPIAPMRVVDLGTGEGPRQATRTCPRCRGVVEAEAQFCRFCGAALTEPNASPPAADGADARPPPLPPVPSLPIASPPPLPPAAHVPKEPAPSVRPVAAAAPRAPQIAKPGEVNARARLVVIAKSGADGASYPLATTFDIGRVEGDLVVGEDPYLSPRHARIVWSGPKLLLRDLASTNGVYLRLSAARDPSRRGGSAREGVSASASGSGESGGEVVVALEDQDHVLVGQQVLKFQILSEAEAGLGPAIEHGTLLFGSPAAPRYARLAQRSVEGVTRDVYYIRKVETVLGRESGDVVFTEDPFLSRRHAAIRVLGANGAPLAAATSVANPASLRFVLADLGSSNGTFLRIKADVELANGDHFRVGQQLFRLELDGAV